MDEVMENVEEINQPRKYIPIMITLIAGDGQDAPENRRVMGHMASLTVEQLQQIDPIVKTLENMLNTFTQQNINSETDSREKQPS